MKIILIGFMGTGKSTVSKRLGEICQMEIVEMDRQIEIEEGRPISEIFSADGEAYFRERETQLLMELLKRENVLISCGGGVPLRTCNVKEMKKNGNVVLLTATPETVWKRVKADRHRPLLEGNMNVEYIRELMESRQERYLKAADLVVATDGKSIEEICKEIISALEEKKRYV